MNDGDRRSQGRCPVCQGPAAIDETMPEGVRCKTSVCIHNHARVVCPRCGKSDLESVGYANKKYTYTCRECTKKWDVEDN